LILQFSDYQNILAAPNSDLEKLNFILKLKKNNQAVSKSFNISINKPIGNINNNSDNLDNLGINNDKNLFENIGEFLNIEYELKGSQDIYFQIKSINEFIDFSTFSFQWTIPHFNDNSLYLNGRKEIFLRVKLSDLLIGDNEIVCEISLYNGKKIQKNFNYLVERNPYGGNCLVNPFNGIALYTNFTFFIEGWKSSSLPLLYKIKYKTKSNILIDVTEGGFFSNNFTINILPEGNNHIFLEISDNKGLSSLNLCSANIRSINNLILIDEILDMKPITEKMMLLDIYNSGVNLNSETLINNSESKKEIEDSFNLINLYYKEISMNFDPNKFLENFDKVISFILNFSNKNLEDIDFQNIFELLDIIVNNIDSLLDDLKKMQILYSIMDNFSKNLNLKRKNF